MYPMLAMALAGYSIYQQSIFGFSLGWTGIILASLPMLMVIMWLLIFQSQARTSKHFPLITALGFVGVGLSLYEFFVVQTDITAVVLSITGLATFLIYNFWYSSLGRSDNSQLSIGRSLPSFNVTKENAETVSSESFLGSPTVLIFFRGNWCPLCMAQIKEIVDKYKELSELGAEIVFISPQPEKNTIKLASKYGLNLRFLTDKNNAAAKILGIEMKSGLPMGMEVLGYDSDTVLPTVIITDAKGNITYSDQTNNYRIRPEPEEFINILKLQVSVG